MKKLLLAATLALTSVSAQAEAPLTGDPFKDVPRICLAQTLDKLEKAKSGKEPTSDIVPFYIEVFKLDQTKSVFVQHSCNMFEAGFLTGYAVAPNDIAQPRIAKRRAPIETDF